MKFTKDTKISIQNITPFSSSNRCSVFVSGTGTCKLVYLDPDGVENEVEVMDPFFSDVINHGANNNLMFIITGASEAAPLYIEIGAIS